MSCLQPAATMAHLARVMVFFQSTFTADFHRDASSLEEAIRSAIANVKSAGYEVERVEMEAEAVAYHA